MFLRQCGLVILGAWVVISAASSCCFVVQDEAHEVYWTQYATQIITASYNITSVTALLTPYPSTTITNYVTNISPTKRIITRSSLVTENPVSLYTNPAYSVPQKIEIIKSTSPTVTGGTTVAFPTGFWVYSSVKVFEASAVTDSNGNVACGADLTFLASATEADACVPTFEAINSHAAAYYGANGTGYEISLTTPFVHVPTRTGRQVNPTKVCAQGNGTENYGYPVQELINHLAQNSFYSAQYPGIENCLPAGPSIKAVNALAISVASGNVTSNVGANPPTIFAVLQTTTDVGPTETAGGNLTATISTITVTNPESPVQSTTTALGYISSSLIPTEPTTSFPTTSITALPDSINTSSTTSETDISVGQTETAFTSGGLLPPDSSLSQSSSSSSDVITSTFTVIPLPNESVSSGFTNTNRTSVDSASTDSASISTTPSPGISTQVPVANTSVSSTQTIPPKSVYVEAITESYTASANANVTSPIKSRPSPASIVTSGSLTGIQNSTSRPEPSPSVFLSSTTRQYISYGMFSCVWSIVSLGLCQVM